MTRGLQHDLPYTCSKRSLKNSYQQVPFCSKEQYTTFDSRGFPLATFQSRSHKEIHTYTKNIGICSEIKNGVFCLFSRKANSFRGPGGFCWPIGVTTALSGRLLPSHGHKLVKNSEIWA
jgi:hypothetical protein